MSALYETNLSSLRLVHRGKVRDLYEVDAQYLLIVQTDRLSAFDVILPNPIPGKGEVLTSVSNFWFDKLRHVIPNHLTGIAPESIVKGEQEQAQVKGRAFVTRKLKPLPIEAIVRGYLAGSGWKDYQKTGAVCGIKLPAGLREAALALYTEAANYAASKGIIIADTKFEFGVDEAGKLYLIDEALTPDSSRFWPADQYRVGSNPPSFDKQFVRDWLESSGWNKQPPAPHIPQEVLQKTSDKYREAQQRLTGA